MDNLLRLPDSRAKRRVVTFDRRELRQLLGLYSARVVTGEWRDYAIDFRPGMALFSIFRHTAEQPLFAIAKVAGQPWTVYAGPRRLAQGEDLGEVLSVFDRKLRVFIGG
ncbi:MAG: DUF2794 domain-containing protein [Alphaproteobacteria bacterium]|nr:DUF2794 domain-containing protein [Alphaproteobacteria bacterium]MCW5739101.1 DUF2794 domain-containing protein [Alphaproteobacteria bacterium]